MKFTIVTPTFNSQKFLEETINSIINQKGNFSIEYIIVDNCSTDKTKDIVFEYIYSLSSGKKIIQCKDVQIHFFSDQDNGMYHAIKKGFSKATGDIFAWINSDDIYLPGAFSIIKKTFSKYPQISWLKGRTSYINEDTAIYLAGPCFLYNQDWIRSGIYGPILYFIQQDSVFWKSKLWNLSNGVNPSYSFAGDFILWRRFAEFAPLYSLNTFVSCFRKVPGQKSEQIKAYWQEVKDYNLIKIKHKSIKRFFNLESSIPRCLRPLCYRLILGNHTYHLVTLNESIEPCLMEGGFYELKKIYELSNLHI